MLPKCQSCVDYVLVVLKPTLARLQHNGLSVIVHLQGQRSAAKMQQSTGPQSPRLLYIRPAAAISY